MSGSESVWKEDDIATLTYRVWMVVDHAPSLVAMGIAAVGVLTLVARTTPHWYFVLIAMLPMVATAWGYFVPMTVSISHDGVERQRLGQRHRIPWQEIKAYQCFSRGFSITPSAVHYTLIPLRSTFIPVPPDMMDEVRYRLRFFVDRETI